MKRILYILILLLCTITLAHAFRLGSFETVSVYNADLGVRKTYGHWRSTTEVNGGFNNISLDWDFIYLNAGHVNRLTLPYARDSYYIYPGGRPIGKYFTITNQSVGVAEIVTRDEDTINGLGSYYIDIGQTVEVQAVTYNKWRVAE